MCYQGAGKLEIHGRQYRLVLEGSLAHLRGLGNDWISPFFMETNEGGGWVGACKKQVIDGNKLDIFWREMVALVNDAC